MGCCVSTKNNPTTPSTLQKTQSLPQPNSPNQHSRAPPPSFQEEKVKEILLSKIAKIPPLSDNFKDSVFIVQKQQNNSQETDKDLSENCSETVSTTSCDNNSDHKRFSLEDENEVKQKIVKSPNLRNGSGRVDSGRRQSPVRRNNVGSVKLVQSKEMGRGQNGKLGSRSDPNERSGRRSSSPVHKYNGNVRRSPCSRKVNGSAGGVRVDRSENDGSKRGLEETRESSRNSNDESVENPLISLECFIFL